MYGKRINSKGRRSAVTAGALLIVGLVAGIFSVVPVIDGADYLAGASANENQVLIGAFFQLLMVAAYVGVPVAIYPAISRHHKGAALGSVAFGAVSGVFIMIGTILLLALLALSHEFVQSAAPDAAYFQTLGELLKTGRDLVNHVATTLAFVLALLLINAVFGQTKQVPLWLSVPGLIGSVLSILASLLFMLRFIGLDAAYMLLNVPIALQQLALAIWLIVKGTDRPLEH